MQPFVFDEDDVALQRKVNDLVDWGLILATAAVIAIGLISIHSATYDGGSSIYFENQIKYAVIGMIASVSLFFLPERILTNLALPAYGLGILLLGLVLTPLGVEVNGQQCWIEIGSFRFQPSELAKFTTLMALASYAGRKGFDIRTMRDLGMMIGIVLLPVGLIMGQPDTGSATVFMAMLLGVFLWAGGDLFLLYILICVPVIAVTALYGVLFDNMLWFALAAVTIAGLAFLFRRNLIVTIVCVSLLIGTGFAVRPVFNQLEPYKQNRLITLFEPERNPRGEGYHVIQSILAVGSGGLTGKGFRKGTQTQLRYIPEQWTDFIFCVPTEEFGFIGGVTVIGLLVAIMTRALSIAGMARTTFASIVCVGFATVLLYHTTVNIGMAIGLFPVMGIPLPFLSAGGTALIMYMSMIGIMLNFHKTRRRRAGRI